MENKEENRVKMMKNHKIKQEKKREREREREREKRGKEMRKNIDLWLVPPQYWKHPKHDDDGGEEIKNKRRQNFTQDFIIKHKTTKIISQSSGKHLLENYGVCDSF